MHGHAKAFVNQLNKWFVSKCPECTRKKQQVVKVRNCAIIILRNVFISKYNFWPTFCLFVRNKTKIYISYEKTPNLSRNRNPICR